MVALTENEVRKSLADIGFLSIDGEEVIDKNLTLLKEKLAKPCLIPLEELKEIVVEKTYKGKKTIQYQYNNLMGLIEKYYDFQSRGFVNHERVLYLQKLPQMQKNYEMNHKMLFSNKMKKAQEKFASIWLYNSIGYIDFWHSLLDSDFKDVQNDSSVFLSCNDEDFIEYQEEADVTSHIFQVIRQIIFKEIMQLGYFQKMPQEIECYIYW